VQNARWKKEIFGVAREPAPETERDREGLRKTIKRVVLGIHPSGGARGRPTSVPTAARGMRIRFSHYRWIEDQSPESVNRTLRHELGREGLNP